MNEETTEGGVRRNLVLLGPSRQTSARALSQLSADLEQVKLDQPAYVAEELDRRYGDGTGPGTGGGLTVEERTLLFNRGIFYGVTTSYDPAGELVVVDVGGVLLTAENTTGFAPRVGDLLSLAYKSGSNDEVVAVGIRSTEAAQVPPPSVIQPTPGYPLAGNPAPANPYHPGNYPILQADHDGSLGYPGETVFYPAGPDSSNAATQQLVIETGTATPHALPLRGSPAEVAAGWACWRDGSGGTDTFHLRNLASGATASWKVPAAGVGVTTVAGGIRPVWHAGTGMFWWVGHRSVAFSYTTSAGQVVNTAQQFPVVFWFNPATGQVANADLDISALGNLYDGTKSYTGVTGTQVWATPNYLFAQFGGGENTVAVLVPAAAGGATVSRWVRDQSIGSTAGMTAVFGSRSGDYLYRRVLNDSYETFGTDGAWSPHKLLASTAGDISLYGPVAESPDGSWYFGVKVRSTALNAAYDPAVWCGGLARLSGGLLSVVWHDPPYPLDGSSSSYSGEPNRIAVTPSGTAVMMFTRRTAVTGGGSGMPCFVAWTPPPPAPAPPA